MKTSMKLIFIATGGLALLGTGMLAERTISRPPATPTETKRATTPITQIVTNTLVRTFTNTVVTIDTTTEDALRRHIADQERLLASKEQELSALREQLETPSKPVPKPRRTSWREREEKLRKEDPERFAEIQQQREAFREQLNQSVQQKTDFLKDLNTAAMTEEEKVGHDELLARIEETWAIVAEMQNGKFPDRATRGKLHESMSAIGELYTQERSYVLRQVGADLGYDEQEAAEFSTYMEDIYELTSPRPPRGMRGMMMGGRGNR
jgi:DNA gyrase/topoisomerase IV subunit A